MAKLYLVRRNFESFVGPMTASQLKRSLHKMEIGVQDEVAGHIGPWVPLENKDELRARYPEVAKAIHESKKAQWAVAEPHSLGAKTQSTMTPLPKKSSGMGLALVFFTVATAAAIAAFLVARNVSFSGRIGVEDRFAKQLSEVSKLVAAEKMGAFKRRMDQTVPVAVPHLLRNTGELRKWLPYLRAYAFLPEARVPGISPKLIRGDHASGAPQSCYYRDWLRRWRSGFSKLPSQLRGETSLGSTARFLLVDPYWVQRRSAPDWIEPKNYHVGCARMAFAALEDLNGELGSSDPGVTEAWYQILRQRLSWILGQEGAIAESSPEIDSGVISHLNCFERASSLESLAECRSLVSPAMMRSLMGRFQWHHFRLLWSGQAPTTANSLATLKSYYRFLSKEPDVAGLDFQPELRFLRKVITSQGKFWNAAQSVQREFTWVRFVP